MAFIGGCFSMIVLLLLYNITVRFGCNFLLTRNKNDNKFLILIEVTVKLGCMHYLAAAGDIGLHDEGRAIELKSITLIGNSSFMHSPI